VVENTCILDIDLVGWPPSLRCISIHDSEIL